MRNRTQFIKDWKKALKSRDPALRDEAAWVLGLMAEKGKKPPEKEGGRAGHDRRRQK